MTVVERFAHRHVETHTQRTYEVGVLVAVVEHCIYHTHLGSALVEVESEDEREPAAAALRCVVAADFHHGMSGTLSFNNGRINFAYKILEVDMAG